MLTVIENIPAAIAVIGLGLRLYIGRPKRKQRS
jgi:hypothetical protein